MGIIHASALGTGSATVDSAFHFFDFPALLRFTPLSQLAFYLGPYYGYDLSASQSDVGVMGGFGVRYSLLTTLKLRVDALYQWGFSDLSATPLSQNTRSFALGRVDV
jgi:hypothetical protein